VRPACLNVNDASTKSLEERSLAYPGEFSSNRSGFFIHTLVGVPNHASTGNTVTGTGAALVARAIAALLYGPVTSPCGHLSILVAAPAARRKKTTRAPFGSADPGVDQACGRDLAIFFALRVRFAHARIVNQPAAHPPNIDCRCLPRACRLASADDLTKECEDQPADFLGVRLESEVPGIEQVHFCLWKVSEIRACASGKEMGVILAPGCQERRLLFAEVLLEGRVKVIAQASKA